MERVRRYIHADYAYKMGLSGKNVTIAVMDTGIVPHPDLKDRIVLFRDFCQNRIGLYDDNGHGTHIAGILAGNGMQSILNKKGNYMGIAPKARLISLKVLDAKGNGSTQNMLEAVDYLLRIRERFHIRILNISVGMLPDAGKKEQLALLEAVERLWDAGIVVVAAAGNNGPKENTVTVPGISRKIVTVGSCDDTEQATLKNGLESGYSGSGPTACCIVKPEILAPGTNIISCNKNMKGYTIKSGTSMAAPVVSGSIALLTELHPDFTPQEIKLRLYERAYPRGRQIGKKCWGIVHVENLIREGKW